MSHCSLRSFSLAFVAFASLAAASSAAPQDTWATPAGMQLLPALARAQDVGPAPGDLPLSIAVSFPYARPQEMQAFVDSLSSPDSAEYRHFVTPVDVGRRFGLPQEQIDSVVDYLTRNGFVVTLVGANRLSILADGTVARARVAFNTTFREYTLVPRDSVEPSQFIANATPIQLPSELAAVVLDVSGLETYTHPRHLTTLLNPVRTRGLYDTAPLFTAGVTGAGRTIGISNFVGFRASNWLLYISHFTLPVPAGGAGTNIAVTAISGGAGAGADNAEGNLDIQMELGMAPLANIRIYDGGANNLIGVLTREVNDNLADVLSESYGWNIPGTTATSAHNLHLSMSAQGITYMAASGDSGTSLEPYSYPNYEPEVLSIGGTVANVNSTTGVRITEVGWNGSGGGWSTNGASFNVRPAWQVGTGVPAINASNNHRLVPDISFHAAGSGTGAYYFYTSGTLSSNAIGTSFASPIFAGLLGVTEQQLISQGGLPADAQGHHRFGRMQDLIYAQNGRPDVWFDITSGGNGTLPSGGASSCTVGWDTVTGWGPMDCIAFANVTGCVVDSDTDGTPDCNDGCPTDPAKVAAGACGCGVPDSDSDGDGTPNCHDVCPNDPTKIALGVCGCGVADTDSDGDGTADCHDACPNDPAKIAAGACGCGVSDVDGDIDGTPDCIDNCPLNPNPAQIDIDGDGVGNVCDNCKTTANASQSNVDGDALGDACDGCPNDPDKSTPGVCGCGVSDTDSDGDGAADCVDGCPSDPAKSSPGACGCGVADVDTDADGIADCVDNCPALANAGQADCDGDNIGDVCEIASGTQFDINLNGIPDSCEACPSLITYCTAGTTTNGCLATMSASGSPSVSATSGFTITASNVEGQKSGLLFYGISGPKGTPWFAGNTSYLCVQPPTQRTASGNTGGTTNACNGALGIDFLAYATANPGSLGMPLAPGEMFWVQAWFRDPPAANTTNLSNGLQFTTCP